jgi:hypothetical protein
LGGFIYSAVAEVKVSFMSNINVVHTSAAAPVVVFPSPYALDTEAVILGGTSMVDNVSCGFIERVDIFGLASTARTVIPALVRSMFICFQLDVILVGCFDGHLRLHSLSDLKLKHVCEHEHQGEVSPVLVTRDNELAITGDTLG